MSQTLAMSQFNAAIEAVESDGATPEEKAEMLMEIAMGMQIRPKSSEQLTQAIALYERALSICPAQAPILGARIRARMGTALQAVPDGGNGALREAQECFESALATLKGTSNPEECAEIEMNLGLVEQALAANGAGRITDAVQHYHSALRVFTREAYPQEFALLHNNLAIAYLSIPLSDERAKMREALAVQSFEEVLKVINLVDHPTEYAMIQNNLGNALQYAASGHPIENNLRALDAYDEALKVRNARDTPLEYANTICNKANVLRNLPADPLAEASAGPSGLVQARTLYEEARQIFRGHGQEAGLGVVNDALREIDEELGVRRVRPRANGHSSSL